MGCGASKATAVSANPTHVVQVRETTTPAPRASSSEVTSPANGEHDSERQFITEDTEGGEAIASAGTQNVELEVSGTKFGKPISGAPPAVANPSGAPAAPDDLDDDTDVSMREMSAASTRSAPVVLQRPSSRGGQAFDFVWEGESGGQQLPRRLEKLQHSSRKKRSELTLDQLQKKLEAAERRRVEYESRIKEKVGTDGRLNRSEEKTVLASRKLEEEENRAEENREAHLKQLRDKLRAKEEHARKVREKKAAAAAAAVTASS